MRAAGLVRFLWFYRSTARKPTIFSRGRVHVFRARCGSCGLRYLESAHNSRGRVFLLLLIISRTDRPSIMPMMIDSHEKPGIGANVIGVEIELEVEVDIVLPTVPSDVLIDVELLTLELLGVVELLEDV